MLRVQIFEITAYDEGCELLDDVLETAFREREDLVSVRGIFNRLGDELDGCAAVHGQQVDQRLEQYALRRLQPPVLPSALLVIGPRNLDIGSQRGQQDVDEGG